MVRRRPSRSADELDAQLDALDDDASTSVLTLAQQSAVRMIEQNGGRFEAISARFTGRLPGSHEIGVRQSTKVLGEFQEVISEIGAVVQDRVPRRGPLPAEVLQATELRLSPEVLPGSVIFTLHPAHNEGLFEATDTLLRQVVKRVFEMFDDVERPDPGAPGSSDAVVAALREFGPRTARHLLDFATTLGSNDLSIDISMVATGHRTRASRISSAGARYLAGVAKKATKRTDEVELVGEVFRLGKDNRHRFIDEQRGEIELKSEDEVTEVLHASFSTGRVRIHANETVTVSPATGGQKATYRALRAAVIEQLV